MTAKMKKISILLCALLSCLNLSACTEYRENQWFDKDMLAEYKISDLPMPELKNAMLVNDAFGRKTFYFNSTLEEVNALAEQIVAYLLANEEVYNLCELEGHGGLIAEMFPYNDYTAVDENFAFEDSGYNFAYSLDPELVIFGGYLECLEDPIEIAIVFTSEDVLKPNWFSKPFTYNAYMTISEPFASCHIVSDGKYSSGII